MFILGGCAFHTPSPRRTTSRPYKIKGRWYYPQPYYELTQTGMASYYGRGNGAHGLPTATGERFCRYQLTAAHKTLPLPCIARVTNLENGRQVVLRINDRGPFVRSRILDVSSAAARRLGFYHAGLARVRLETLVAESLALSENRPGFKRRRSRVKKSRHLGARKRYSLSSKKRRSSVCKKSSKRVRKRFHKRSLRLKKMSRTPRSIEDLLIF